VPEGRCAWFGSGARPTVSTSRWQGPSPARKGYPLTTSATHPLTEQDLLQRLDKSRLPRHVAVIMDGNGRWARGQGQPRLEGHRASRQSVRETVRVCNDLGIEFLTLYTFSAENWRRPPAEVAALMALIEETLKAETAELHQNQVAVAHLGVTDGLPASLLEVLDRAAELTRHNTGLKLYLAINYGGRQEIAAAAAALAREVMAGTLSLEEITEENLRKRLYRPELPDPDLLVRTGGDLRISNYLLWQMAYTEIYVTPVLWPDFRKVHLLEGLLDYQGRQRRFGGVMEPRMSDQCNG